MAASVCRSQHDSSWPEVNENVDDINACIALPQMISKKSVWHLPIERNEHAQRPPMHNILLFILITNTNILPCHCGLFTDDLIKEYQASPHLKGMNMPDVQHHMQHMRHLTFKRLTEQAGSRPTAAAGATGSSSSSRQQQQQVLMTDIPLNHVHPDQISNITSPVGLSGVDAENSGLGVALELGHMKGI